MKIIRTGFSIALLLCCFCSFAQDSAQVFSWTLSSKKLGGGRYELVFHTAGNDNWQLYAPDQVLSDVATASLSFPDSAVIAAGGFHLSGPVKEQPSQVFEGIREKISLGPVSWTREIRIAGAVPATLQGSLLYTYGKGNQFYQQEYHFSVTLEGGVQNMSRIRIPSIDIAHPVHACGDDDVADKGYWKLFFIGLGAGLFSLLLPCIFPLIPLTVSFFTKRSASRRKGIVNALWYGFSIFLIFVLLSLPFHILNLPPEILNNISTNVPLNLCFFVVFIVFAISFFGYFEISLPGGFASKVDARSGLGDFLGIFFMAATLVIVSFSCTSGILGTLIFGSIGSQQGAWQLTACMAGFGLGLGLPFVLFALFPNWLQSLPKSGGWMNELKVVFGFIELAMAVKFLSNADLVKQWGIFRREVFFAIWALLGLCIILYLAGLIRFPHDSKPRWTKARVFFIAIFSILTLYLVPGITNTPWARLSLISGFPPPFSYSIYPHSVNYESGVRPLENDYEKALALARAQHKPVLIDFTGWACVNCRRMEEHVWVNDEVKLLMNKEFIVVSLYVDERKKLPLTERVNYTTKSGAEKSILTVGDKWATFQAENFNSVSQPQYAIVSPDEKALTKTKTYTPDPRQFANWLRCGLDAYKNQQHTP